MSLSLIGGQQLNYIYCYLLPIPILIFFISTDYLLTTLWQMFCAHKLWLKYVCHCFIEKLCRIPMAIQIIVLNLIVYY